MSDLYEAFYREGITADILWKLTEKDIEKIGLSVGQGVRYREAKGKEQRKLLEDTVTTGIGRFLKDNVNSVFEEFYLRIKDNLSITSIYYRNT